MKGEVSAVDIRTQRRFQGNVAGSQSQLPFFDGRVSFWSIREAVLTARYSEYASSDFAKMASEGLARTLKCWRANKDKNKMRQKLWGLGGTEWATRLESKLRKDLRKPAVGDLQDRRKLLDYKSPLTLLLISPAEQIETYLRQQRECLPVQSSVWDELLNIVREKNVVIAFCRRDSFWKDNLLLGNPSWRISNMCSRKQPSLPEVQPTIPELKHLICSCTIAGTVADNQSSFFINMLYLKPPWNRSLNDNDSPHSIGMYACFARKRRISG